MTIYKKFLYHVIKKKRIVGDRFNREIIEVLLVPEHGECDGVAGGHVLDDGGHVEMAPVPDSEVTHLDQQVTHKQLTRLGS